MQNELPEMFQLLLYADLITEARAQELMTILENSPTKSVTDVLLESGIVNERELDCLQLAKDLLRKNKT